AWTGRGERVDTRLARHAQVAQHAGATAHTQAAAESRGATAHHDAASVIDQQRLITSYCDAVACPDRPGGNRFASQRKRASDLERVKLLDIRDIAGPTFRTFRAARTGWTLWTERALWTRGTWWGYRRLQDLQTCSVRQLARCIS